MKNIFLLSFIEFTDFSGIFIEIKRNFGFVVVIFVCCYNRLL